MADKTLVGLNLCRYRHLRTWDAPILALACPMPGLVGTLLLMNRLSLRNNRLKFKTAGKLPIVSEEFKEHTPILMKQNRRMSTCNRLDLQTLGSQPIIPINIPDHCSRFQEIYRSFQKKLWNVPQIDEERTERCRYVTAWTSKYWDLDHLCPKISPSTRCNSNLSVECTQVKLHHD